MIEGRRRAPLVVCASAPRRRVPSYDTAHVRPLARRHRACPRLLAALLVASAALGLVAAACGGGGSPAVAPATPAPPIEGSGTLTTITRPLSGLGEFTAVAVEGGLPVTVLRKRGAPSRIDVTADGNLLDRITYTVTDGTLTVATSAPIALSPGAHIKVVLPFLDAITAREGSVVTVEDVDAGPFEAVASGGASLRVEGFASEVRVTASGGATLDLEGLAAAVVRLDVGGGSTVVVRASTSVLGAAREGSRVTIHGAARRVEVETSGGATVVRAGE